MLICLIAGDAEREERKGNRGKRDFKELVPTALEAGKPTVGMVGQQSGGQ